MVTDTLDHLAPWMPFAADGYSPDDADAFIGVCERDWAQRANFNYAIVAPDGRVCGSTGIMVRPELGVEIGYWLHHAYTGQGLATRTSAVLAAESFRIGAAYVEIVHDVANVRSRAVPQRLGFVEVELLVDVEEPAGARTGSKAVWRLLPQA